LGEYVQALLLNKTRSFLTILGVIIGVCAVIAMGAIGEGAKAQVVAQLSSEQAVGGLAHLNSTEVTMIAPIPA
jgi:ABC-type antimicrobial peptide transport system permease subunit